MTSRDDSRRIVNFRPMLSAAIGLAAGIAFCVRANAGFDTTGIKASLSAPLIVAACFFAVAAAVFGAYRRSRRLFVTAAFFLIGAARVMLAFPDAVTAQDCTVVGTIVDIDGTPNSAGQCEAVLKNAYCGEKRLTYRVLVKLYSEDADLLEVGDRVSVMCGCVRPTSYYRGVYNERLMKLASGISEKAEAKADGVRVLVKRAAPVRALAHAARQRLSARIEKIFGDNAGVVSAFLLGIKDEIPEDVYDDMRDGGVAHLLSLSGFHVGVLTALLLFVLPKGRRVLRFAIITAFLLVYCSVTGFGPSLVRASVMCACLLLADAVGRRSDTLSSLSLAAAILLLYDPFLLYSVGFCLSFSAVLGIALITSAGRPRVVGRFAQKTVSLLYGTVGATAATALIAARYFGKLYVCSIPANLLLAPLFSAAMTLCFILLLLSFVSLPAASALAFIPNRMIVLALTLLRGINSLPYACIEAFTPSQFSCVLMLVLLFCASGFVLRGAKEKIRIALPVFAVFTASLIADIIRA